MLHRREQEDRMPKNVDVVEISRGVGSQKLADRRTPTHRINASQRKN